MVVNRTPEWVGWGAQWWSMVHREDGGGVELVIVSICVAQETSSFFRVFSS